MGSLCGHERGMLILGVIICGMILKQFRQSHYEMAGLLDYGNCFGGICCYLSCDILDEPHSSDPPEVINKYNIYNKNIIIMGDIIFSGTNFFKQMLMFSF